MINLETLDLSTLPGVALESKSELPTQSAIYFAIDSQGTIQYIGRSGNLKQRWSQHHRYSQLVSTGNIRIAYLFLDADLLPNVEEALIKWFQPHLNKTPTGKVASTSGRSTVMVRMYIETKEKLDEIASQDRRTLQDTLEILLREAIENRKAIAKDRTA